MAMTSEAEWKTVSKSDKKRIARNTRKQSGQNDGGWHVYHSAGADESSVTPMSNSEVEKSISQCRQELQSTKLFQQLQEAVLRGPPPSAIVCYGIGNFGRKQSTPSAPLWQLACAMQLRILLTREEKDIPMYYYEPFMTPEEGSYLKTTSVQVIAENERGRREANEPTLFFMPHCPLELYSNVVFANRERLENIMIVGNSLVHYANRLEQNEHTKLLKHLQQFWEEHPIALPRDEISQLPGHFEQAFNDSAVTFFGKTKVLNLPTALVESLTKTIDKPSELV